MRGPYLFGFRCLVVPIYRQSGVHVFHACRSNSSVVQTLLFNLIIKRMKKLFLILSMSMLFMACSDDKDDYTGQIPSAISLYVGETQKIDAVGANSSNEFVASVSNKGEVRAEHVGTARISAGFQRHCTVTVKPKYNIYPDPYIKWGASVSDVMRAAGTPTKQESAKLTYKISDTTVIIYEFKQGGLSSVAVGLTNSIPTASQLVYFMGERYFPVGSQDGLYAFIDGYSYESATTVIGFMYKKPLWGILYRPIDAVIKNSAIQSLLK